jgi:hypothetical protein
MVGNLEVELDWYGELGLSLPVRITRPKKPLV